MSPVSITKPHFSGVYTLAIKMCSRLPFGTQGLSLGATIISFSLKEKENGDLCWLFLFSISACCFVNGAGDYTIKMNSGHRLKSLELSISKYYRVH